MSTWLRNLVWCRRYTRIVQRIKRQNGTVSNKESRLLELNRRRDGQISELYRFLRITVAPEQFEFQFYTALLRTRLGATEAQRVFRTSIWAHERREPTMTFDD